MRSERRGASRIKQRIKLRFRSEGGGWRTGGTIDLSFSGMFISCKRVPEGPEVEIKLAHGRKQLVLKGEVIRRVGTPTELGPGGFVVKLVDQPEGWSELCRSLRARLSARRRTTEFTVPTPDAD